MMSRLTKRTCACYLNWQRRHRVKSSARPELTTAALRSSQTTLATVDNFAPHLARPDSTYKLLKIVQTSGATSVRRLFKKY